MTSHTRSRRRWPSAVKRQIVQEAMHPDVTLKSVAIKYGIRPHHLSVWKREMQNDAHDNTNTMYSTNRPTFDVQNFSTGDLSSDVHVAQMEQIIGRLFVENARLRQELSIVRNHQPQTLS